MSAVKKVAIAVFVAYLVVANYCRFKEGLGMRCHAACVEIDYE